ncbi:MAG: hypothetical protein WA719_07790 [Thermoplasmata archaeon]
MTRWYLLPCLVIVGAAVALMYWGFVGSLPANSAIPPGVDPAHWITLSKSFVGLPFPSADPTLQPLLYPPLTFPLLGAVLLATGNPITTAYIFAGTLLALFGLTTIHVARRYLLTGPFQVLFVGLILFNGAVLQVMFWGGYPNLLALVLFNEALVFLLAFTRTRSMRDGLLFYAFASLVFLTHDLTFVVLLGTLLVAGAFLLAQDRRWLRLIFSWANLCGLLLLGATVAAYTLATDSLAIPHPGYLSTNPAAYVLDNLGELFHPLGYAPFWWPIGPAIALDSALMTEILVAVAAATFVTMLLVRRWRSGWVPPRLTLALASLVAACLLPVGGWLAHVDTDYARFTLFFVLPLGLTATIVVERFLRPWMAPGPAVAAVVPGGAVDGSAEGHATVAPRWSPDRTPSWWAIRAGVALVLVAVFVGVSVPTVQLSESTYASSTHNSGFVEAMQWLRSNGSSGAVLADTSDTQRWVQALSDRNAFTYGPTWLHFYGWQVLSDLESYFAVNSHYTISNNLVAATMGGTSSNSLNNTPGYAVFVEGVVVPILRINATQFDVNFNNTSGAQNIVYDPATWSPSAVAYSASPVPTLSFAYRTQNFLLNVSTSVGPGSQASDAITVTPADSSVEITRVSLNLTQPEPTPLAQRGTIASLSRSANLITWQTSAKIGQLPSPRTLTTQVLLSAVPIGKFSNLIGGVGYHLTFSNPTVHGALSVSLTMSTPGTSNPATTFPTYFDTNAFLAQNNIHFLVLVNTPGMGRIFAYYESEFQFAPAYSNPEWKILWRA